MREFHIFLRGVVMRTGRIGWWFLILCLGLLKPVQAEVRWAANGLNLTNLTGDQENPKIVSDDSNGALIVWDDKRGADFDIYIQRIDSNGQPWVSDNWGVYYPNGVPVCTAAGNQVGPAIVKTTDNAVIVFWHSNTVGASSNEWDLHAQKIGFDGYPQWAAGGVTVCAQANAQLLSPIQYDPDTGQFLIYGEGFRVLPDEDGGALAAWQDYRTAFWDTRYPGQEHWAGIDIYCQRVDKNGNLLWGAPVSGGLRVNQLSARNNPGAYTTDCANATLAPDGQGGLLAVWEDNRNPATPDADREAEIDIYSQGVRSNGQIAWLQDMPVCTAAGRQWSPVIATDGSQGGIVVWRDDRNSGVAGQGWDIYAQRIDGSGNPVWPAAVSVCAAAGDQTDKFVISDNTGGAIAAWVDERNSAVSGRDLYCQRLRADGTAYWTWNGVDICTASGDQYNLQLYPDQSMGLLAVWTDQRNETTQPDIYAQRIDQTGNFRWSADGEIICNAAGEQWLPFINNGPFNGAVIVWQDKRAPANGFDIYVQSVNNPPWELAALTPGTAVCGDAISVTVTGTMFVTSPPTQANLTRPGFLPVAGQNLQVVSETVLWCDFNLAGALSGLWSLSVGDGQKVSSLGRCLAVKMKITQIQPSVALNASPFTAVISGLGFRDYTVPVLFSAAAQLTATLVQATASSLECRFTPSGAETGTWDLKLTDNEGVENTLAQALSWTTPTPSPTVVITLNRREARFFPNPAKEATGIMLDVPASGTLRLSFYNIAGDRVLRLEQEVATGWLNVPVDISRLGPGVYFCRPELVESAQPKSWRKIKLAVLE